MNTTRRGLIDTAEKRCELCLGKERILHQIHVLYAGNLLSPQPIMCIGQRQAGRVLCVHIIACWLLNVIGYNVKMGGWRLRERNMKKSKAQIFLEQVENIDVIIENKLIEQGQWKDLALSITANMIGERVQSSGSKSRMEDAAIKCMAMEKEIDLSIDKLISKKRNVVRTIEKLYSPIEYKILHMRYIQHISLMGISEKLKKDYTWVTTTHGRALKNVQKIIDKKYL